MSRWLKFTRDPTIAANGKHLVIGFITLLLFMLVTGCENQLPAAKIGTTAPTFTLNHLNGTTIQFPGQYRGKVVAIRFWADWCPFCKTEMTALEPVYRHYHDRGLVILAINVMQSPAEVRAFTERMGISYEVLLDSRGEVMRRYGVMGLPMTFIVDQHGVIKARIVGESTAEAFESILNELL